MTDMMIDLPEHFPLTVNAAGQGPETDPTLIDKIICWCSRPERCAKHAEFLPNGDHLQDQHFPTTGMRVAMGVTCECGFWEARTFARTPSSDGLEVHRSEVAEISRLISGLNA